ncbi:SIR2 family NAD-dependent protein deacylase [Sphingomonas prati]|uniref:SIR2 family protein n=1 Tax=Sphingomonas prati TaxID=1843237 RepID=A0A7W9F2Z9_9SPHN|nr:SIR2 family protein [Sphingomonas prati]MBB5730967.1 hypothetical protein [Sphingomonas prati]GGE98168.1 hypothetical protein GCM10011404_34160 [Sphingomonas prati]
MKRETETFLAKLSAIPDYPALRDVQNALWAVGEARGAAVMVGAGFSLNAERASGSTPAPPLWRDFTRRMTADLYASSPEDANTDPLRLAEEYRAALGQPALDAMIRELVPDRLWTPGGLHRELLSLPWADVLTTNWDTLLERAAAEDHDRAYEVVETVEAIARTRSPRIVKLHGTLPSHTPFIFAAEDYRTYPRHFSPFVNLAQQVMLENEMVLIGFSGDDPNFLQWAGWVRDQLGASARRIRLIGVLGLTAARRRLLESQNVTPIDLEPLVREIDPADRQRVATEVLLASLRNAKPEPPHRWNLHGERSGDEHDEMEPARLISIWSASRRAYPGWLLAPPRHRYQIRFAMERQLARLEAAFDQLDTRLRAGLAREIVWRCDVSLWDLPIWVATALPGLVTDPASGYDRRTRLEVNLSLASHARRRRDRDQFEQFCSAAEAEAQSADDNASIAYERCIEARDRLDYDIVSGLLPGVRGTDPAWTLRRASLQAFMRERRRAVTTAREALQELRRRRTRDRTSVWLISREAWAHLAVKQGWLDLPEEEADHGEWPHRYREHSCDPWDELTHFDQELQKQDRRDGPGSAVAEPRFEPGVRLRNHGLGGWLSSANLRAHDEMSRAVDMAGFIRLPGVDVIEERLQRAALMLGEEECDSWSVLRTVRDWSKGLINERFNRVAVARMQSDVVERQIQALRLAVEFGRARLQPGAGIDGERHNHWVEQIRRLMELLSRLTLRLDTDSAVEMFEWAQGLTLDAALNHWWLFEPLGNLLNRSFDAIDPAARDQQTLRILQIPLPGERGDQTMESYWPELVQRLDGSGSSVDRHGSAWRGRVTATISAIQTNTGLARSRGILRIYVLSKRGLLSSAEAEEAAAALWANVDHEKPHLPPAQELMSHIFLDLPEPSPGLADRAFRADVVERILCGSASHIDFESLGGAANAARPLNLSSQEAETIAALLLAWEPSDASRQFVLYNREEAFGRAHALARAVLPAISDLGATDELAKQVLAMARRAPAFLETLPILAQRHPASAEHAYREIRRAMGSRDVETAYSAWRAIYAWIKLDQDGVLALPGALPADVVASVAARREPALLPALQRAEELILSDRMDNRGHEFVVEALDILHSDTAYSNQEREGLRADTLTMVRAACVRLANALAVKGVSDDVVARWLDEAPDDPLPEVRYALALKPD